MAKNSIFAKIKNVFMRTWAWIDIKYHRWVKKEIPYMKTAIGYKYKYMPMHTEEETGMLETWAYKRNPNESTEYTRMQAAKALTRGKPEPGCEMPRLVREQKV